jgi:nicotinate-nucleotide adenylyltransferase
MTVKIGVLGGTFDPIHFAHLAAAEHSLREIGLEKVIFVPAGNPYFKDLNSISSAEDRFSMVKLALEGKEYFEISRIELDRSGPSFSVETIESMKNHLYPYDEFFFILGWDSLISLHQWHEASKLIKLCRIAGVPRPGCAMPDTRKMEENLPGISGRLILLDKPRMNISSTEIRSRVRAGLDIDDMVPGKVAEYIRQKGLYTD